MGKVENHFAVFVSVVCAVTALSVGASAYQPGPRILEMRGITRAGSHTVITGETVASGKTLQTSPDGHLYLRYADGSGVVLGRTTRYRVIEQPDSSETIWAELIEGTLRVKLPQRVGPERTQSVRKFVVRARGLIAGARGADFSLEVPPKGTPQPITLRVAEGTVDAALSQFQLDHGKSIRLVGGEFVRVEPKMTQIPKPQRSGVAQ